MVRPTFGNRTKALVVDICWSSPTLVGRVACPVVDRLSWASRYRTLLRSKLFSFSLAWSSRLCVSVTDSWRSCLTFCRQLMEASKERSHARRNRLVEASSQTGPTGRWEWSLPASSTGGMGFEGLGEGSLTSSSGRLFNHASRSSNWPSAGSHSTPVTPPVAAGLGVVRRDSG